MNHPAEKKFTISGRLRSFVFAFKGLRFVIRSQHNFLIHLVIAFIVVFAGLACRLNGTEWCMIVLAMSLVFSMEVMNTAIENLVDLVSPGHHEQAGMVKDIAAGAVLIAAVSSVIVGLIIFIPKML